MKTNTLFDPVTCLPGVGIKTAASLSTLGINSLYDLLFYFPFRYDDLENIPLDSVVDGQKVLLKGIVATPPYLNRFGYRKTRLTFKMRIDHDIVMVNFFNQPWLKNKLEVGQDIAVYGKYAVARQSLAGIKIVAVKSENVDAMAPVYPVNKHVKQKKLTELIKQAIETHLSDLSDIVPDDIRKKYRLFSDQELVQKMHQPKSPNDAKLAKRSAIFREFFLFQIQLALLNKHETMGSGIAKKYDLKEVAKLTKSLPFELSNDQKHVINEIFADMHSKNPMRRLLQGDVGSGKTIVAVFAIYAAITAGFQAALMVPTEILATQHFAKIDELLRPLGVRVALITGSTKKIEKKEIYQELKDGTINVVIGTHALIQKDVEFNNLGLIIIDEQHRFGVMQRQKLINKAKKPDVLAMTATPIPRTLALTVYGQMKVSEIRHLPAGRVPIISKWITNSHLDEMIQLMQNQLKLGFQIYVVTPLITESEKIDLENAEHLHRKMQEFFPNCNVVLLHGQMPGNKKDKIMSEFADGKINILVTTSVIEVGVDVANANMMVIFNADRFGLSQLHQLRGRIGRGKTQSFSIFVADPTNDVGKKRMQIIESTTDGFELAQEDLKLRGEGDLFGKAQSGLPEFRNGDVVNNYNTMVVAHQVAQKIVDEDPDLNNHQFLNEVINYKKLSHED